MDRKQTGNSSLQKRVPINTLQSNLIPGSEVIASQALTQCSPAGSGGDGTQSSTSLTSELCELASKFDRESFIKVDSMFSQPCRDLEEVPIFGIEETDGEVQHNDLSGTNVDLTERMSVFDAAGLDSSSNIETRTEDSSGVLAEVEDGVESKEAKVDLLSTAPFLVSEEGVWFQCFPISEKEVIIVSLDDDALLMNDSLPGHITATSESNAEESTSLLRIDSVSSSVTEEKIDVEKKVTDPSVHQLEIDLSVTSHDNTSSSLSLSTSGGRESNCNTPSCDVAELSGINKVSVGSNLKPVFNVISASLPPAVVKNIQGNSSVSRKRKLKFIAENAEEGPRKEAKITYATIYAPVVRKPRSLAADCEEQPSLEWFRCSMCSSNLPSTATLRHHLVNKHKQKDIKSFLCFLCKQECWSESQQEWHLRVHHGIKNKAAACPVCGVQLSTPAECKAHVRKHPATLVCPSCSLKFSAQHQLVTHVKEHLEQLQPHICVVCGSRFTSPGTLQVHSWRHRSQKCPQDGCEHVVEDESWLVIHLQQEHMMNGRQILNVISVRNASDHKVDILLSKYSSLFENPSSSLSSYNLEEYLNLENIDLPATRDSHEQLGNSTTEEKSSSCSGRNSKSTADEDCNIFTNVVNNLMEAVVGAEEEEMKGIRREEEILQKVTEEGPALHRCGLCNIYLPSVEELATHKAGHNQAIICLKCQKSFLSVKQLKRHMTVHNSQDSSQQGAEKQKVAHEHRCLECGKTCGSESALSRHRGTHARSLGRHQCQTCKRRVRTRAHLIEHMARVHKINHESKKLQCPICDRRFTSKAHLELHLISHGEREPLWSCDKCGRNYVRPRSLQRHMASHDQKFVCSTCDESFMSARRLAVHARVHDPLHKTRLSCPKCPRRYAYASQLQVHMRIHTGEKPYVCETCGKCFKRLQQCRAHHRMIHGNHKEACIECGKMFGDKTNLLRHRLMVHYHLKRWVCGVCAQSYAYSQDLRNHLQKQHNLAFERLDGTNKKSRHEIYVVPELGSQDLSEIVRRTVESVCALERRKVQQVLSGTSSILRNLKKTGTENMEDADYPDDPSSLQEHPLTIAPLIVNNPPSVQETALTVTPVLVPSATIAVPTVVESNPIQADEKSGQNLTSVVEGKVQGFMRLAGVTCSECGVEATTPLQCGPCGALVCSQAHMDLHVTSNHRVMFQCSVCGLHYGSQSECVTHVTATHSSHLLAVQGNTTTHLTSQLSQPLQINGGANVPSQLCLPLTHSQATPQGVVQVGGCSSQVPLVIAPSTANVTPHHLETNNVILQYPNVNVLPTGLPVLPHSTTVDFTKNQGKQAVLTMTGVLSSQQQTQPKHQRKVSPTLDKQEEQPESSLCTITLPSSNDGGLLLPSGENHAISLSNGQNMASLPALISQMSNSGENSTILMGNANINTQQNDSAPVLLVGSLPFNNLNMSAGSPTVISQNKQCNLNNQGNTSMASVLLTLAESPHQEPTSAPVPSDPPGVVEEQVKQPPSSSMIVSNLPVPKTEGDSNTGDGSTLLQSLRGLPVPAEEEMHVSPSSALDAQVAHGASSQGPPQEVSVEIIQPRPRKAKAESRAAKLFWEKEASRLQRDEDNEVSNNLAMNVAYKCQTCGKNFQSMAHLERHQRTHDSQRFKCHVCDKAFTEKYNLKTHMLIHTGERPHVCTQCLKSFRYMRDLTEHKLNHEGSRPHVCKMCGKGFVRRRDYTRHLREQHGTQRHQCKICGSSFQRRIYLETVHMRTHHPQPEQATLEKTKPEQNASNHKETKDSHICQICGRTFARARYLTSHLRTHSRRADYVRCPRCPRMFTSEQTLKVHKEAFHDRETTGLQDINSSDIEESDQKQAPVACLFPELSQTPDTKDSKPIIQSQINESSPTTDSSQTILTSSQLQPLSSEVASHLLQTSSQVIAGDPPPHGSTSSQCGEELETIKMEWWHRMQDGGL
ncbi:uncharacterized protein [Panulirus ornatus]|uniref:uncharacterized protein isoform X2 n=1 Tax=Panulirus ornatus TaxID=150431 RepID=UPI003A85D584